MKKVITSEYYRKVRAVLPDKEFRKIERNINRIRQEKLEAFWHIIVAGYPIDFALSNYKYLYNYIDTHEVEYKDALTTYINYPHLDMGIYVTKTQWYELN